MPQGYFVTGTDTGVGKTLVSTALLHAFARLGKRVVGMKPVVAGARTLDGGLYWEDVEALIAASNVFAPSEAVNPYAFRAFVAPHLGAQQEGVCIELDKIREGFQKLTRVAQIVVVEGAGGFKVPLDEKTEMSAIPAALGIPVILVVGLRLGCLNHALLTQEAITAAGLRLAAWVGSVIDPEIAALAENVEYLRRRLEAPCLGVVPFLHDPAPYRAKEFLNLSGLVEP
jgi:dethiobiotin synthetase